MGIYSRLQRPCKHQAITWALPASEAPQKKERKNRTWARGRCRDDLFSARHLTALPEAYLPKLVCAALSACQACQASGLVSFSFSPREAGRTRRGVGFAFAGGPAHPLPCLFLICLSYTHQGPLTCTLPLLCYCTPAPPLHSGSMSACVCVFDCVCGRLSGGCTLQQRASCVG